MIGLPGYGLVYSKYLKNVFTWNCTTALTVVTARCYLTPIEVPVRMTFDAIVVELGTTFAGNMRLAIYRDNGDTPVGGALIYETASEAKIGTGKNEIVMPNLTLEPGLYWLAFQSDENTTNMVVEPASFCQGGTLQTYYYALGGYGVFTNPCPAVIVGTAAVVWLRVASIYQPVVP